MIIRILRTEMAKLKQELQSHRIIVAEIDWRLIMISFLYNRIVRSLDIDFNVFGSKKCEKDLLSTFKFAVSCVDTNDNVVEGIQSCVILRIYIGTILEKQLYMIKLTFFYCSKQGNRLFTFITANLIDACG